MDLDDRYEFLDKIGSGSYATVYRARDSELGREIAVKQIHEQYLEDPGQLERYWQEAQLLASLHHPNIVTIFDIQRDRGWLIMELMQANLAQRMAGRQMNLTSLRTTVAHVLRALKYLHSQGIVHGDIKPSNLMIDARRRIKIGDFGFARRVSNDEGSMLKGTTKYMAPEAVSDEFGDVGPASDLYSLGFCAYELMCGPNFESLFPGLDAHARNMQAAWMMWHAAPDRRLPEISRVLEGVPDDLARVIQKLCVKDQSVRYSTADEALSDLNIDVKVLKQGGASDETTEPVETTDVIDKKRLWIAAAAMAFSVILSVFLLLPSGDTSMTDNEPALKIGMVKEVLADKGMIVISGIDDPGVEEIYLGKKPRIYLLNKSDYILLRELQPNDRVEFVYKEDGKGRRKLELTVARPVTNSGTIRDIQLAQKRVEVSIEEGNRRETLMLRVPAPAKFLLNGLKTELHALQVGDGISFSHMAERERKKGGRVLVNMEAFRMQETVGYVVAYDAANRQLTYRFGQGTNSQIRTLPIDEKCTLSLQGSAESGPAGFPLTDLRRDDRIRFTHDSAIRKIEVTREKLKAVGVIREVLIESNQIVVTISQSGKPLTFSVSSQTEVTLSNQNVHLAELRKYDAVVINYDELSDKRLAAATIDATRSQQADRWAIVIGVESYSDPFLSPLRYSIRNAHHLEQSLIDRYAFKKERILMLIDKDAATMRKEIVQLLDRASAQTQVILYVSSHAYVGPDNAVYLAGTDFKFDKMTDTGLPLDWLVQTMESCTAKDKLVLLDCSHSGNQKDLNSQPSTATMVRKLKTPRKSTSMIASCGDGQRGNNWPEKQLGLFAFFLAEGFGGAADVDRDLHITVQEAFHYLKKSMSAAKLPAGIKQTPVLFLPL